MFGQGIRQLRTLQQVAAASSSSGGGGVNYLGGSCSSSSADHPRLISSFLFPSSQPTQSIANFKQRVICF
jgi:hypothetical protein